MSVDRYTEIKAVPIMFNNIKVIAHIPTPTDADYKKGYIVRHFVQKANDESAPIFEIKKQGLTKFNSNPFYLTTSLDWRLTGTPEEIKTSNSISIKLASEKLPKIQLYLPNLLQFYKK